MIAAFKRVLPLHLVRRKKTFSRLLSVEGTSLDRNVFCLLDFVNVLLSLFVSHSCRGALR